MDVPVNDGDAVHGVFGLGIASGDRNVVEDAEAHRCGWPGMMAWRTHRTESVLRATVKHSIDGINDSTHRVQGYLTRLRTNAHITAREFILSRCNQAQDTFDVRGFVTEADFRQIGPPGRNDDRIFKSFKRLPNNHQPLGAFRVAEFGEVTRQIVVKKQRRLRHGYEKRV